MTFDDALRKRVTLMRELGILKLKSSDFLSSSGEVEIELEPREPSSPFDIRVMPEPGLVADETPTVVRDPLLCNECQERPKGRIDKNLCRECALSAAGVVL